MFLPVVVPVTDPTRVQRLERALGHTLDLLQTVVERLDEKFGPGFLGDELAHFAAAGRNEQLATIIEGIDQAVRDGQSAAAARMIRSEFDVTWSEAHSAVGTWRQIPRHQRLRWLQLSRFIRDIEATSPAGG